MKRLSKSFAALLLLAAVCTCFSPHASAAGTQLPDGVCAAVELGSASELLSHLDDLGNALVDRPLGRRLRRATDVPWLRAVDKTAPARVLILDPPLHLLPVFTFRAKDPQKFFDRLKDRLKQQRWGMRIYDLPRFVRCAAARGNRIVMSAAPAAVQKVLGLIGDGALGPGRILPGHDAALCLRPSRLLERFEQMGANPFQQIKQVLEHQHKTNPESLPPGSMTAARIELDAAESLFRQTDSVLWSLSLDADGVRLGAAITAHEDTALADFFSRTPGGRLRTLDHVPADSLMAFAMKNPGLEEFVRWSGNAMREIQAATGGDIGAIDKLATLMEKVAAVQGEELCLFVRANEDATVQCARIMELEAPAAFRALFPLHREFLAAASEQEAPGVVQMEFRVKRRAATHGGHDITEVLNVCDFRVPENAPPGQGQQMMETLERLCGKLFGGNTFAEYSTVAREVSLSAVGPGSLELLKKLIDRRVAPLTESSAWREQHGSGAARHAGLAYVSLDGLQEWVHRAFGLEKAPAELPALIVTADVSGRTLQCRLEVPTGTVRPLARAIVQRTQQATQRTDCLNHLKEIGAGLAIYEHEHGTLPGSLAALYPEYIDWKDLLVCPADDDPMTLQDGTKCSYHYVGRLPDVATGSYESAVLVVAYDKKGNHPPPGAGRNALFHDWHGEYVPEERFQDLLGRGLEILKKSEAWDTLLEERKAELEAFYHDRHE